MEGPSASYSKKRKWLIGALMPVMALCLALGLIFMSATDGLERVGAATVTFNNIVNANVGMHPKWELDTCISVEGGGVGDTYTSAHKIWRVSTDKTNDPLMEKSPSYVFQGNEAHAAELMETYSLRAGNEVVFNITDGDSAAKVWADAIAFAQSIGKERALVEDDLADCSGNNKTSNDGSHNGWRVGSNVGVRNHYKGNFFLENVDEKGNQVSLGQYITVRLQTDWVAKKVTAKIPQTIHKVTDNSKGDYIEISGETKELETTTFDYIKTDLQDENDGYLETTTNYLEFLSADGVGTKNDFNQVTAFNCISTKDGYTLSYDLASNGFDYDVSISTALESEPDNNAKQSTRAIKVFNDYCAFSFGRLHIPTGVYIVLDLNGHRLDRNLAGEKGDFYGSVISVSNVARLEIMDGTAYENASAARIEERDGAHTTNHKGTITGGHIKALDNKFDEDYAQNAAFPVDMRLRFQYMGAAVNIAPWGDFVMHSGMVQGNKTEGASDGGSHGGSGGAFYQRSKGAVTIFDGYVIDNYASNKGGVTILGDGSGCAFTMYGGVLAHNEARAYGGAVQLGTATYANFHGGEIVNNTAGQRGGAINLFANTLGILDSVTITGNKVTEATASSSQNGDGHGGAIYIDDSAYSVDQYRKENGYGPGFRFRGSLQIYKNYCGSKEENVFLSYDASGELSSSSGVPDIDYIPGFAKIAIGGPMIANGIVANVGVTLGNYDNDTVFTSGYGENGNSGVNTFLYFSSDNDTHSVVNEGNDTSREAKMGNKTSANSGLTWLIEGTGIDADTDLSDPEKGESTLKIVIPSSGDPTFYYKNPNNNHGFQNALAQVQAESQMNKEVKLTSGGSSSKLLDVLKDRFSFSNGSLTFEYSMLKVTRISVYANGATFTPSGNDLTTQQAVLAEWKSVSASGDKNYTITNTFDAVNFRFKMGTEDLTASKNSVTDGMTKAISATDGCISYAGEYSVLYSGGGETRYENPSFKIRINQVGVEVGRSLYYNGQNIETELKWLKDIDWDNSGTTAESGENAKLGNEKNQPYFIYSGDYYYPILNADYNSLSVFHLYNPFTKEYHTVSKGQFTGYVLEFTYANEYFGTKQPVQFGSHSGGGIEYQTMHRQPNSISGIGTYVPGVKNAGMYSVKFISSRSAVSADEDDADHAATGVYFAANNFAFSSEINIYVDPASAEVELTDQAKAGFTYDAGELKDEEIVIYDNTSNTHVNPHLDSAAVLEYFLFDDLKFKAGIYDVRTKLYYTLDQVASQEAWDKVRPYGQKIKDGKEDTDWIAEAEKDNHPYFPSYKDSELTEAPTVVWNKEGTEKFDPNTNSIPSGILSEEQLIEFQKLYEKETYATSTGKLVYIVDKSSFDTAKKLEGNPMDARRYAVFVSLDLDAGYDDYNYEFDQDAEHLVGLDDDTAYFWAFEFTVAPAVVRPYDFDTTEEVPPIPTAEDKNTSVSVEREVVFNGLGQFQLPTLTFTDLLGVHRQLIGSAAEFKNGGHTFGTGLYYGSPLTVQSGYDFIVKYYIEEYGLKEGDNYLDYVNVMNGQKLKVRIYIPEYKDKNGAPTGANGNYAFYSGSGSGELEHDDEGYYYEITYEITPVTVTTSLTVTYTYDGTSREEEYKPDLYNEDQTKYPEQGGKVGMGVGGVYATTRPGNKNEAGELGSQEGFIYPFSMVKDNTGTATHGQEVGPAVGEGKKKYTISNASWVFSSEEYQKNTNISFGSGVYTFNTGSPNVGRYALNTATQLKNRNAIKTEHNTEKLDIDAGVVWVFAFSNLNDTGHTYSRQGLNSTADESGNYGNFVIDSNNSSVTVIIEAKSITDDNVFATKIQQAKKGASLSDGATIDGDGYADVAYTTNGGAVVQDTAATDGKYKMATFPFAGVNTFYRPKVKLNYYKYGVNGTTEATARGTDVTSITEGTDFTLVWSDNNMVSVTSEAAGISSAATGSFASVIVNAQGNYTGSLTVNFYIRPAIIEISHTSGEYDFKKGAGDPSATYNGYYFDRNSHGIQLTYSNTEDYTPYEHILGNARGEELSSTQVAVLKTSTNIDISSVAYAYTSQELFDAFYKKYFEDKTVSAKELEDLNKLYSTSAPVDADVYYVAIALSNENFVFKQETDEEEFPSITGSNFGNGATNNLVRGTFEIKPATVTASLVGKSEEFYNRLSHTASFNFKNNREAQGENAIPSDVLGEYTVTYQCGATVHNSTEGMVDAGKYTVTVTVGMHAWFNEGNITADMKTGVDIPEPTRSNFLFNATGDETRPFDFEIKPAEIKLDKFSDVAYNKSGQGVTLGFTNTERNNEAVPTLASAGTDDAVTADEYTITYAPDGATPNAKLDGSNLPLNAGKYNVTVALTDAAKSKEDTSLYNFKFIVTEGTDQTIDTEKVGKTISSSYTITPATVNASVEQQSLTYNGKEQKQDVIFENALDEDTIVPEVMGDDANADGVEYSVKYKYDGFAGEGYDGFTNRGSYSITVTLKTNGNYTFGKSKGSYTYTFALNYSILAKSIADEDVTLSGTPSTIVYTGESLTPPFTLTATNILGGYPLKENDDYNVMRTRDVEVYYSAEDKKTVVTVTINGQNNFSGTRTFTFTILPARVSVTANEGTAPDGTITVPYNKFPQSLEFTFTNKEAGGTVVPMFYPNESTTNYKVTYKNQDATDGKTYTQLDAPVNAGTYTVTVTLTGIYAGGNFTFEDGTIEKTFTLIITPAELTIRIANTFAKGDEFVKSFVYDGQDYYSRLYGFTLDNDDKTVPVGTDVTEAFYLGKYSSGVLQSSFMDVGEYYILFTFTTEKNVSTNYTVTVIAANTVPLTPKTDYTVQTDGSIVIPFSITPAQISVNELANKTYTGENITADIYFTNSMSGGVTPSNFTAAYSGGTASGDHVVNAGTYTVTVTLSGDDAKNFEIVEGNPRQFTVDPAIISASVAALNFTYDGQAHQQEVQFYNASGTAIPKTKGNLAEGNEYSVEYSYSGFSKHPNGNFTDSGYYGITVELKEGGNFAFGKSGSDYTYRTAFSYNILAKSIEDEDVTVSGITDGEHRTYTGASLTPTDIQLSATAIGGGYTLKLNEDYNIAHTPDVEVYYDDAADQTVVTVTISGQNNFGGTRTFTFTIDPAEVSVTATGESEGKVTVSYNKFAQALDFTFVNGATSVLPTLAQAAGFSTYTVTYKNQDPSDAETYTQANAPRNVGTYTVTVTLGKGGKGNFTFDGGVYTKTFTLEITPAELKLTIADLFADGSKFDNSFVYDGKDYYSRLSYFALDNANKIVPASSDVTEKFFLGTYPDGTEQTSGFKNAAQYYILFTFSPENNVNKNYKVTEIHASGATLAVDIDYTVEDDGIILIKFTITPAEVSLGELANKTYTGSDIKADISFNNDSEGSDVLPSSYTVSYTGGLDHVVNAGTYTVTVTLTGEDGTNFTLTDGETEFTVDPAIINASVAEQQFTYDGEKHQQDVVFENSLGEGAVTPTKLDDEYKVTYTFEGTSQETDGGFKDRGLYSISVDLTKDGNFAFGKDASGKYNYHYDISYSILPKAITKDDVTGIKDNEHKTYTGESLTPSITIKTMFTGGEYTLTAEGEYADYTITNTADVNAYTTSGAPNQVRVTISGQNNFSGTLTYTFFIDPAVVSVTADEGTLPNGEYKTPYNKYQQALAFTFVNSWNADVLPIFNANEKSTNYTVIYKNRDSSDPTSYTQTHAPINAGTYDVTVTLKDKGNFTFEDGGLTKTFVLIIERAQLTLTISESFASGGKFVKSFVYDGRDYYARLNNFTLDNANDTVPVGSEVTEAFYLGIYPETKGSALTRFTDAGDYYILFTFKKDAEKDIGKNYEIIAIYAGSEAVALTNADYSKDDSSIVIPFKITPAHITVNELSNKTYTGKDITAEISFTNVSGSEVVPTTFTVAYDNLGDHVVDAGKYTVTVTLDGTDATNFEIVAWDSGATKTREFTVDPARLAVVLKDSVVNYSGSNYTVEAIFSNTSETEIVPTMIGSDYSFSLVATDDPTVTPAYNAVIDAKTYNVTVTLLDDNFVFTDGEMAVVLAYTINAGNIELSELGKSMTEKWKDVSYNPANAIETKFEKEHFTLVGSRQSDLDGMIIALLSCTTTDGEYTQEDGYYRITKKGTYEVTIQVSAPNHNTQTFTFDIDVQGENVLINVPKDFSDFLTAQYGSELGAEGLRNAFLDLIKNGKLTVVNIPNSELTNERSGQRVVDWLEDYGFAVSVSGGSTSTSGHLRAGDYALTVSLNVDGGIRFHEDANDDAQVVTSITRFYRITPAVIKIDWGTLDSLKFNGRDQADAIKNGVKISNFLEGDIVRIALNHITIGTKDPDFTGMDKVVNAVQEGTQTLIQYYLRLLVDDATLTGDDRANYVFATEGRVEESYFEEAFTIARLELNILLSNSSSYYGNDYTENFAFTHTDISGSASVDMDEDMLREAVLSVLKLYLADVEVVEDIPSVNEYQVKAAERSKDFGNFELEFGTAEAKHTINPRPVTLQMASSGSIYGETIVLPDQENAWTLAAGSLEVLEKDLEAIRKAVTISTNATSSSPVKGVYTTSGTVVPNDVSHNYNITFAEGVYTITPRPIIIDITDRTSVYGEALDDDLTGDGAWKVSTTVNRDAGAGDLNFGLRPGDSPADLGVVLSLTLIYTNYPTCNRDGEGNIIPWANVISGNATNENYTVTAWINGNYMVTPRKVIIEIGNREAVYGDDLARVGSTIALTAPVLNDDNTAVIMAGDWTYASSLGSSTYAILPVDMNYLTFYVGRADNMSESAYAYVGKYPLVGAWAFGLGDSAVSYCYDITFTGKWTASLNSAEKFDGANDNGAGVYEIKPASITEEGRWTVNKFFYETSNPDKTEENGWFKMFLEQMLFSLKGDFNAPLSDITPSSFTYSPEKSEAGKTTAFTAILRVNGKDELLTIIFAKPQYSGIGSPTTEEPFYNESDHLWYVHTSGNWTSKVSISVANHDDAEFTLTYVISDVVATVSLNASIGALEAVYGDYQYLALAAGLGHYDEKDIKDLPLSKALMEYIFGDPSMIITVTGFETAFPEWTLADCIRELIENCWVEVVDARISTGGYLMAGSYTLRLVARMGSGFIVNFKASSAVLAEGEVDQGAGNRLVIRQRVIGIDWVDPAAAKTDEIIREDGDKITYTYSGYEYSQQPMFTDLLTGDLVDVPAFQLLTETGAVVATAKNVRRGGYYTIKVLQSALEGADSANYRLPSDMTIRLDIIPREIHITIDDLESTVYGVEPDLGRVFTVDDWQVTAGKGLGLAAGETKADLGIALRLELPSKNAALYENAVKGEGNNENYEFHFEGGNYEITPKPINITIEDKESFYGDELAALGFTVDDDLLAYEDTVDDLHVALAKASGLDVGDYPITGVSGNLNYTVTFTDGTYKIKRATNVWTREFQAFEFLEGENPSEDQQPLARFGDVHLHYFYDEACTEEIELDDLSELEDGVYYVRAVVDGTNNYTPLDDLYTFMILPRYSAFGNNLDIGLYVSIWSIQVVALPGAVIFIRRRKNKNRNQKS